MPKVSNDNSVDDDNDAQEQQQQQQVGGNVSPNWKLSKSEQTFEALPGLELYKFKRGDDAELICFAQTDLDTLYVRHPGLKKLVTKYLRLKYPNCKTYFKTKPFENRVDFQACFSNNATNGKCLVPLDVVQASLGELDLENTARRDSLVAFISKMTPQEKDWALHELAQGIGARVVLAAQQQQAAAAAAAASQQQQQQQLSAAASFAPISSSMFLPSGGTAALLQQRLKPTSVVEPALDYSIRSSTTTTTARSGLFDAYARSRIKFEDQSVNDGGLVGESSRTIDEHSFDHKRKRMSGELQYIPNSPPNGVSMMLGGSLMMSVPFMAFNSANNNNNNSNNNNGMCKDETEFEPTENSSSGASSVTSADAEVDELFEELAMREPIVVTPQLRPIVQAVQQDQPQSSQSSSAAAAQAAQVAAAAMMNATATKKRLLRAPTFGFGAATPTASWPAIRDDRLYYQPQQQSSSSQQQTSFGSQSYQQQPQLQQQQQQQQSFDMLSRDGPLLFGLRGSSGVRSAAVDMATDAAELTLNTLVSAVDRWALDEPPCIDPRAIHSSDKTVSLSSTNSSSSSSSTSPAQSGGVGTASPHNIKGVVSSLRTLRTLSRR